jgi:hypothetical protein
MGRKYLPKYSMPELRFAQAFPITIVEPYCYSVPLDEKTKIIIFRCYYYYCEGNSFVTRI